MQTLQGLPDPSGKKIEPYLADTRSLSASQAYPYRRRKSFCTVSLLRSYGKRLVFEMTFPDYPFAFARGGGLLAPKLLKENFNDLMYAVYRGAALEYDSKELWACIDLWFLDKFPFEGAVDGGITPPRSCCRRLSSPIRRGLIKYTSNR